MMDGAFTGKTGFTNKAGYCYVGALKRDGKCLIVALLACGWPNHKTYKWSDSRELFTYGLENFTYRSFEEETFSGREQLLMPIPVLRAQNDALTEEVLLPVEPDPETEGVEGLFNGVMTRMWRSSTVRNSTLRLPWRQENDGGRDQLSGRRQGMAQRTSDRSKECGSHRLRMVRQADPLALFGEIPMKK